VTRSPDDVRRLLESMGEEPVPERDGVEEMERRHRIGVVVDERLDRLAAARALRRRRTLIASVALAFSAGAAAAWVVLRMPVNPSDVVATLTAEEPVEVRHAGAVSQQHGVATRLEASDEIHTLGTAATAVLASGANVELGRDSTVRFEERAPSATPGEDLVLSHGMVSLRVPKLGAHRTLSVVTPDARVTVRGTRFSVAVDGTGDRRETRVRVTEGSVWVDHGGKQDVLGAGQSWSSLAPVVASDTTPTTPATVPTALPEIAPIPAIPDASAPRTAFAARAASTLAAENEAYRRAVAAVRAGDDAHAVGLLEGFVARFPGSPLAQNATVERLRALSRLGRRESAARAARQYLAEYPRGFARDEATALTAPPNAAP
jgi:hypothetical protein